ncbi:MAG: methyltransferase domain-containing protein [Verrucomicrobia bacterium]|jgi:SAM-dependent methyltransferase|nr:methyltransferase domain-containing protein [Verrucomicrobiota bacterium]
MQKKSALRKMMENRDIRTWGRKIRKTNLAFWLYRLGILSHDMIYGPDYYKNMDRESALKDAEHFADVIISGYSPERVIEFGCGTGRLLYPYHRRGISVKGLELSTFAKEISKLPDSRLESHDLTKPYSASETYDIALCIEVVEHLPPSASDIIVSSISDSAPVAIITSARPGQGGTHHVNEQPFEYWIEKFETKNMIYNEERAKYMREELELKDLTWISDNIMIFENSQ